ncbi:MAG: hypothetical protein ABI716_02875, partial [Candidatus Saccharibacteria bacterium]
MAVKAMPKLIRDFWPTFRREATIIIFASQTLIAGILATALIMTGVFEPESIVLWAVVVGTFLAGVIASMCLLYYATRPSIDLLSAVINVAGEPTTTTPPNPNDTRYATNGLKQALQTIYELAGKDITTSSQIGIPLATRAIAIESALDTVSCGFIILGHDRKVIYANRIARLNVARDDAQSLSLLFNGTDTLNAWLDECEEHEVHAEHIWTRIGDRMPEDEDRRLFDVIATYQKGTATETVLTLIDRTATYSVN